ncbi:MAG: DUF4395 domain-containing protein [Sulfurimonas sp.]
MKEFFKYGEIVEGYDVRVLNEREARAGAGILFAIGMLSLTNAAMLHHFEVTRYFIMFFLSDFLIRVINPSYAPSLLMGRFFVRNQVPEYVGATQKRFAWGLGLLLAMPMFYLVVINWQANPIKIVICVICLLLLVFESAFSICLGCKIYNLIMPTPATNCPGGVCEIQKKDKIQTFNIGQKIIVSFAFIGILYGSYAYIYKLDNKTQIGKMASIMTMSDKDKKILQDKKYQQDLDSFEDEEF